jgi:hypothetical protein
MPRIFDTPSPIFNILMVDKYPVVPILKGINGKQDKVGDWTYDFATPEDAAKAAECIKDGMPFGVDITEAPQ